MRKIITILLLLLAVPSLVCANQILRVASGIIASSGGTDYTDIIYYHNCDALGDATKSEGSATVTYSGFALETVSQILGSGSWDNDNWGANYINIPISSNFDMSSGRFGFYFEPQEIADGQIVASDGGDFSFGNSFGTNCYVNYLGGSTSGSSSVFSSGVSAYIEFLFDEVGGTCTVYVDGVQYIQSTGGSGSFNDTTLRFTSDDSNAWDGFFDQVISSNDSERNINAIKTVLDFN